MSSQAFNLDPSLANLPLDVLKKKYEDLTPEQRRLLGFNRPATQAEFDAAQQSQGSGAPADFSGRVLPNPDNVQISDDTESGIPALRLPNGVTAQTGAYNGTPKLDTSNPATAQVLPEAMQTIGADFSPNLSKENSDATVPVFMPNAQPGDKPRDIPFSQVKDSLGAGGKMGVRMQDPSGTIRYIPADQMQIAVQYGGKVLPIEEQSIQHPGFWKRYLGDFNLPGGVSPYAGMDAEQKQAIATQAAAEDQQRKEEGRGLPYRVVAGATGAVAPVAGMEESAREGDVNGVLGHMAAGQTMAAAPLIVEGVAKGAKALTDKVSTPVKTAPVRLAARTVEAAANQKLVPVRKIANLMTPADEAEALEVKVPGRDYGLPKKEVTTAPVERDATRQNEPYAGEEEVDEGKPEAKETPTPKNAAAARVNAPDTSPKAVKQQLEKSLDAAPPPPKTVPGVKIKNQPAAIAAKLPEGFTSTESSLLKGYKYDPATQELDGVLNTGERYRHAQVSPDQFSQFEKDAADSPGKAWNKLRNGAGVTAMGKVDAAGKLQPRIQPKMMRSVEVDPATGQPEFSDVLEAKRKNLQDFIAKPNETPAVKTPAKAKPAASPKAEVPADDLEAKLQQSLDQVKAQKGGVAASAAPEELTKRWGVDENALVDTDANVRGLSEKQSKAYLDKLTKSYKEGKPVQPVMETRDANNNIISVDGRHRALAAQKAGIKRIPVIVRRIGVVQ